MRHLLMLIVIFASLAWAEYLPSNGNQEYGDGGWYLWTDTTSGGKATWQAGVPGIGYQESRGAFVEVTHKAKQTWQMQFQAPLWLADSGKVYEFRFYAKASKPGMKLVAIVQGGPPGWDTKDGLDVVVDTAWQEFKYTFYSTEQGYGTSRLDFYLLSEGKYWIDEVKVTPQDAAIDTAWFGTAEARIDSLRKVPFLVSAQVDGVPVVGALVKMDLERHQFPFGTALALQASRDSQELWYRSAAAKYFWAGVPENQFKWPDYERSKGSPNREGLKEYLDFAKQNGWTMRGHALVWGIQLFGFDQHWGIQGDCADIARNIKGRIDRDMQEYQGKFQEYDVWNEPFHEPFLFEKCGWSLMDSAFTWAHRADPTARLYINEYDVVEAGRTETYFKLVQGMLQRGVPVQGIGVQCHFQARPVLPALIKLRLDRLAELGLPLKVTEFDIGSMNGGLTLSEEKQATEDVKFMRTVFSHPAVAGIMMWGFWDQRHWIEKGGIISADGRAKPAAVSLYDLWNRQWSTHASLTTDSTGTVKFRGFPGQYRITVQAQGRAWIRDVWLDAKAPAATLEFISNAKRREDGADR